MSEFFDEFLQLLESNFKIKYLASKVESDRCTGKEERILNANTHELSGHDQEKRHKRVISDNSQSFDLLVGYFESASMNKTFHSLFVFYPVTRDQLFHSKKA